MFAFCWQKEWHFYGQKRLYKAISRGTGLEEGTNRAVVCSFVAIGFCLGARSLLQMANVP